MLYFQLLSRPYFKLYSKSHRSYSLLSNIYFKFFDPASTLNSLKSNTDQNLSNKNYKEAYHNISKIINLLPSLPPAMSKDLSLYLHQKSKKFAEIKKYQIALSISESAYNLVEASQEKEAQSELEITLFYATMLKANKKAEASERVILDKEKLINSLNDLKLKADYFEHLGLCKYQLLKYNESISYFKLSRDLYKDTDKFKWLKSNVYLIHLYDIVKDHENMNDCKNQCNVFLNTQIFEVSESFFYYLGLWINCIMIRIEKNEALRTIDELFKSFSRFDNEVQFKIRKLFYNNMKKLNLSQKFGVKLAQECLDFSLKTKQADFEVADGYYILGKEYFLQKNIKPAILNAQKAAGLYEGLDDQLKQASSLSILVKMYYFIGDIEMYKEANRKYGEIGKKMGDAEIIREYKENLKNLDILNPIRK